VALLLGTLFVPTLAQAAEPGDVNLSFGDNGRVRGTGCYHGAHFASVAIDSRDRIVTAGSGCLSRTLPSGRPDRAFANAARSGIVDRSPPFRRGTDSVTFDRSRIVTAGYYGGREGFALSRYKGDGGRDHSFNFDGNPPTTDFGERNASALSVAIDSHRRPVAAGYTQGVDGDADFALARFKWNGALDPSFGTGGKVTTDLGSDGDYATSVAIDSRGRIVVGGGGRGTRFELARYEPDGTLDPSFGTGGKVTTDFGRPGALNSIAIDARGRIVAAGAAGRHCALARYWPSGNLDRRFSNDGKVTCPLRNEHREGAGSVAIDSRGRIVAVAGSGVHEFRLARYKPNGSLDRSFGRHGKVETHLTRPDVWSAALDSRDRIVVAATNSVLVLVRFIGYRRH
jgi:uncharacterized delta-60 repeat protein